MGGVMIVKHDYLINKIIKYNTIMNMQQVTVECRNEPVVTGRVMFTNRQQLKHAGIVAVEDVTHCTSSADERLVPRLRQYGNFLTM